MGKKSKRRGGKRDDERSPNVRNSPSDAVAEMLHAPVPDPQSMQIRIIDQNGEETFVKVTRTTKLEKVFDAFSARYKEGPAAFEFLFNGQSVGGHQTTADIGMEDGEHLDARYLGTSDATWLNIRIREQTGEETYFKLKYTTKLEKVINAYAERKGVAATTLHFLFHGQSVLGDDTAAGIGMESGDQIDCFPRTDDEEDSQAEDDEALARRLQREWEEEDNRRFKTREAVVTDDADGENFDEYMGLILEDKSTARDGRAILHAMERWPRIRKYWPRVRRRICSACGKHTLDLSQPRYLVCGGCGKGRGVGRYCSEACQAEHWPVHSMHCAYHHVCGK